MVSRVQPTIRTSGEYRLRQMRNLLATMLLAQGTPMIVAGDERGRTQQGNNNAFCQDNEISWVNWSDNEESTGLREFVVKLLETRKKYRILHNGTFLTGESHQRPPYRDVTWFNSMGTEMEEQQWNEHRCFGMLVDGRALEEEDGNVLLIVFNGHVGTVDMTMPPAPEIQCWRPILSTAGEVPEPAAIGEQVEMMERSVMLFEGSSDRS